MAFSLPVFNLSADGWRYPSSPASSGPTDVAIAVQLYFQSRASTAFLDGAPGTTFTAGVIRIDPATGILNPFIWIWEIPAGSGLWYRVTFKDLMHQGFPNEYPFHVCVQCDNAGLEIRRDVP